MWCERTRCTACGKRFFRMLGPWCPECGAKDEFLEAASESEGLTSVWIRAAFFAFGIPIVFFVLLLLLAFLLSGFEPTEWAGTEVRPEPIG